MSRFEDLYARVRPLRESHFVKNIAIGLAISIFIELLGMLGPFVNLKGATLDWEIANLTGSHTGTDIAFIDIDAQSEVAYADERGNPPYFTPRDKLATLIASAVNAGPRVVVVDIDLSQPPDGDPLVEAYREVTGRRIPEGERNRRILRAPIGALDSVQRFYLGNWMLADYLRRYSLGCARRPVSGNPNGGCTPIVLARSLGSESIYASDMRGHRALPSFLDRDLADSKSVLWGSTAFDHDSDYVVRRWRLWEPVCDASGRGEVLPASALLAYAFGKPLAPGEARWDYELFRTNANRFAPAGCPGGNSSEGMSARTTAPNGDCRPTWPFSPESEAESTCVRKVELTSDDTERTVVGKIRWSDYANSPAHIPAVLLTDPRSRFHLAGCSQRDDPRTLCDKIVVVGSSRSDNGDYHRTQVGEVPGSFVLINAIDQLLSAQPVVRETPLLSYAVEFALIVLLAWLFVRYEPSRPVLIGVTVATAALFFILSFLLLLNFGIWYDMAMPLLGIQVHELIARAEGASEHSKEITRA